MPAGADAPQGRTVGGSYFLWPLLYRGGGN